MELIDNLMLEIGRLHMKAQKHDKECARMVLAITEVTDAIQGWQCGKLSDETREVLSKVNMKLCDILNYHSMKYAGK